MNDQSHGSLRLGLIADDLTGACDAGVQFAQSGFSTFVRVGARETGPPDLVVLSTRSRHDAPATAVEKVQAACRALASEGRTVIFKKVDSTLRGNLGAELEAAMQACDCPLALLAPAFPAMGRTLENGQLRVADSAPPGAKLLPDLLREQCRLRVAQFGLPALNQTDEDLSVRLEKLSTEDTIVVLDSKHNEDLLAIARAGIELRGRALLAGSAGLAAAAAKVLAERFGKIAPPLNSGGAPRHAEGSAVLMLGSTNPVTMAQIQYLLRNSQTLRIEMSAESLERAAGTLKRRQNILLILPPRQIDANLVRSFLAVINNPGACGLVLSGGDTAFAILRALGTSGIKLESEVLPGVPFGILMGGMADGTPVVTKAGGFGGEDALAVTASFLAQRKKPHER